MLLVPSSGCKSQPVLLRENKLHIYILPQKFNNSFQTVLAWWEPYADYIVWLNLTLSWIPLENHDVRWHNKNLSDQSSTPLCADESAQEESYTLLEFNCIYMITLYALYYSKRQ